MSLLSRMRDHNRRTGVRVYNQLRLSLAMISPGFVALGALGLLGFGETRVSDQLVEGTSRVVTGLVFIVLGLIIGVLRLTVFRTPRVPE